MRFSRDRRGQSVVIGTVLVFGFLIIGLSLYQVQVVPQQNAQTEFEHFESVQNDLVDLRAGILQAGSTDRTQYQTVRLGTSYSTRAFAINPPAPAGQIRTSDPYNITIDPESGAPINVSTRFVEYRPGYNEIGRSPTRYDASVLYTDARDNGGGIAVIEGQELVDNDGNVAIVAVQNEFQRSGTGRVTIELRPAESVTDDIPDGPLTVTIPTRLSGEEYWNGADIPDETYGGVSAPNDDGVRNLTLETTGENLTVDTVGVGEAPEEPKQNENARVGGSDGGTGNNGGTDGGFAQDVEIVDVQINKNMDDRFVVIQFRNNNESQVQFTRARLDSYTEDNIQGGSDPIDRVVYDPGDVQLVEGTSLEPVGGPTISNGGNADVTLNPARPPGNSANPDPEQGDEFVIAIEFSDGSIRQYTVTL